MSDIKELRRLLTASGAWPNLEDAKCDDGEHVSYVCPACAGEGRLEGFRDSLEAWRNHSLASRRDMAASLLGALGIAVDVTPPAEARL